jgi:hypothetical protein
VVFNEYRGHFLTRLEVSELMGCSPETVARHPGLLRVPGLYPGDELYPSSQFDHDGIPTPGLAELAQALRPELGDREIASYCTLPMRALGGRSPIDFLRQGGQIALAAEAARAA